MFWKLLIDKNASESNNSDQTDSDDDIEGKDYSTGRNHFHEE